MPTRSVPFARTQVPTLAAESLVGGLPRDQALGLRLIALARTAAAMHMSELAAGQPPSPEAAALSATQAAGLAREVRS